MQLKYYGFKNKFQMYNRCDCMYDCYDFKLFMIIVNLTF